jgi:hypothetical protein
MLPREVNENAWIFFSKVVCRERKLFGGNLHQSFASFSWLGF